MIERMTNREWRMGVERRGKSWGNVEGGKDLEGDGMVEKVAM